MTKRQQQREAEKAKRTGLELRHVKAITANQTKAFESWWTGKNLMLHGTTGTGKSFLGLYMALEAVVKQQEYDRVVIVRSVVPTRDMGFLPGNMKEKAKIYEAPYYSICEELFGRGDAYDILKQRGHIEFITTSFLRGLTLPNSIILIDEAQNLTSHEADTMISRVGRNSKVIFAGDIRQTDLNKGREYSGLHDFMEIIRKMKSFDIIEFHTEDIVRSSLVKEYIIARNTLEDQGVIVPLNRS